jgi:thioredoxin reductase (NADPH)
MAQGGQLMATSEVDNWPADVRGVQGPELMLEYAERSRLKWCLTQRALPP